MTSKKIPNLKNFVNITNGDIYTKLIELEKNVIGMYEVIQSNRRSINRLWWFMGIIFTFVTSLVLFILHSKI